MITQADYLSDEEYEKFFNEEGGSKNDLFNLHSLILTETDFSSLVIKGKDIDDIFQEYNDFARD